MSRQNKQPTNTSAAGDERRSRRATERWFRITLQFKLNTAYGVTGVPATGSWKSRVHEQHQREHDAKHEGNHEGHCIKGCNTDCHGSP